jgi:hypothetical protein
LKALCFPPARAKFLDSLKYPIAAIGVNLFRRLKNIGGRETFSSKAGLNELNVMEYSRRNAKIFLQQQ